MPISIRILILEESLTDIELMIEQLRRYDYDPDWVCGLSLQDYIDKLNESFHVIIKGQIPAEFETLYALELLEQKQLDIPLIVITNTISQELAVECMKSGAADYLHKDRITLLGESVESALQAKRLREEKRQAENVLKESAERFRRLAENYINDRIQMEAELEELKKFRSLVELSLVGIYIIQDGVITYANTALAEMLGYSLQEMIGKSAMNFLPPQDRTLGTENIRKRFDGEINSLRYPFRLQRQDGSLIDVEIHGRVINVDEKPAIMGVLLDITASKQGEFALKKVNEYLESKVEERTTFLRQLVRRLLIEVTERHRIEAALRLNEERYAMAVSGGQVGVWDYHLETKEIYLAPILKEMLGYDHEEIASDPDDWMERIHHDDRLRGLEAISAHLEGLIPQIEIEHRLLHKNGSTRWFLSRGKAFRDANGYPERIAGSSTDITGRKQAEEALRESEARFRQLAETIHEVFWMTNLDKTMVLYVSPAYEEIWGRTCNQLYEQPLSWFESIHPEDRDRILVAIFEKQIKGEYKEEYRIIRPDNSVRWIRDCAFPIRNDLGDVYRIAGIAEDFTDRKQAEEEIRRALDKEKELSELKSRFVTMTSHEFRTPLSTILSAAELLEYYGSQWTQEENTEQLHLIQDAVKHITQLLEEVLFIGRAEVGKLQFHCVSLEITQFCSELVNKIGNYPSTMGNPQDDAASVRLTYSRPSINFVGPEQAIWANVDEKLLRQILSNLLSNAIKYSPHGGNIQLELSCSDESIIFAVRDQGIGIPLEDQPHLFDSFHRGKNVGNIPGTGLGLAIVKQCVDLHHGKISVNSQGNVGTTFTVTLPLRRNC